MGGAGRSCADTIRRSRQNVAIATQVLSPRAIGSSLKCQRGVKHFGPADDDEEGFLTYRRRTAWKKLFYYGLTVVGVILIITAIIIAMGFVQTEKHKRILTRSPSLKHSHENNPTSYIYNTTPEPTDSLSPTESQEFLPTASSSFLVSSKDRNYKEEKWIPLPPRQPFGSYPEQNEHDQYSSHEIDFESHEDKQENQGAAKTEGLRLPFLNGHGPFHHHHSDNDPNEKEESEPEDDIYEGDTRVASPLPSGDNLNEDVNEAGSKEKESVDNSNKVTIDNEGSRDDDDWKSSIVGSQPNDEHYQNEEEGADRAALSTQEEVKVVESQDDDDDHAVFSIEVPIYISNRTIHEMQHQNDNDEGYNTPTEMTLEDKDNSSTILTAHEIEEDEPTDISKVHEVEVKELDMDELHEAIQDTDKSSSAGETEVTAAALSQKSDNDNVDDDDHHPHDGNFHRAVLHTALFHLEDDNHSMSKIIPDIIERHSDSPRTLAGYDHRIITPKSRRLENRIRGRNRKIKIFKNDKVMNLKATYNPVGQDETNLDEHIRAKNYTSNEPPSDFVDIRDFVTEIKRRPLVVPPLPQNFPKLSKSIYDEKDEGVGTARLMSASTPSLEEILRSIFSSYPPTLHGTKPYQSSGTLPDGILTPSYQQQQPPPNSDFGASFASSLNHIISPGLLFQPGTRSPDNADPNSSQFRKRTFYSVHDHELFDNPSTFPIPPTSPKSENYFVHLLGQNPQLGSIGSLSPNAVGGSLNNYYAPIFTTTTTPSTSQYDFSSSGTHDSPQQLTLPGVIPFDISSSFIQAAYPTPGSSQFSPGTSDQLAQLGITNFYQPPTSYNPSTYNFNTNEPSKSNNHQHQQFNPANLGGNIGTLTTSAGQAPTYNTISQGMHLLNLISGVMPNTYFHDQVYNPSQTWPTSNIQSDIFGSASQQGQNQFPGLAFPFSNINNFNAPNSGSFGALKSSDYSHSPDSFQTPIASSSVVYSKSSKAEKLDKKQSKVRPTTSTIREVFHFDADHADGSAPSSDRPLLDEENDQLPAASALTQDIMVTVPAPKSMKSSLTTTSEITPLLRSKLSPDPDEKNWGIEPLHKTPSQLRSFSFQILPHKDAKKSPQTGESTSGNLIVDTLRNLKQEVIPTSLDNFVSESKSKKKASVSLETPKVSFYKPLTTTPNAIFSSTPNTNNIQLKIEESLADHSFHKQKFASNKEQRKPNGNDKHSKLKKPNSKKNVFNTNGLKSGFFVL